MSAGLTKDVHGIDGAIGSEGVEVEAPEADAGAKPMK